MKFIVPTNDEIAHIVEYQNVKNAFFSPKKPPCRRGFATLLTLPARISLAGADLQSVPHDTGKARIANPRRQINSDYTSFSLYLNRKFIGTRNDGVVDDTLIPVTRARNEAILSISDCTYNFQTRNR